MSLYNKLVNNLTTLKLEKMVEMLPSILDSFKSDNISFSEALLKLTDAEIDFKDDRARKINVQISSFPYQKTINDFDFNYQPQINKSAIEDLCSLRFMETKSNVVFMGTSDGLIVNRLYCRSRLKKYDFPIIYRSRFRREAYANFE